PRLTLHCVKRLADISRRKSVDRSIIEYAFDVIQKHRADRLDLARHEGSSRLPGAGWPVRSNCIGDREQGPPVISNPINETAHLGIVATYNVDVVIHPPRAHA